MDTRPQTPLLKAARRLTALTLTVAALAGPAASTWSVVAVDTATGEVCVASATCLGIDLKRGLAVVRVGRGAAAAQSFIDTEGTNRELIWDYLTIDKSPGAILDALAATDSGHQTRQYGIVNLADAPVSWQGTGVGGAKRTVSGQIGTIRYAIQGNLLTGVQVVNRARARFENTPGDLSQRVMAAMDKARELGGDGRCSCAPSFPTSCGVPPPKMVRSCLSAFIVLARIGDTDGTCSVSPGCANGDYYLDLQIIGGIPENPDPMNRLTEVYLDWRASKLAVPDHVKSIVTPAYTVLPADGVAGTTITVELRDIDGVKLSQGGAHVRVHELDASKRKTRIGAVRDHGDGEYSFRVQAGFLDGEVRYVITADDPTNPTKPIRLYPDVALRLTPTGAGGGLGGG